MPALQNYISQVNRHIASGITLLEMYQNDLVVSDLPPTREIGTLLYALRLLIEDIHFPRVRRIYFPHLKSDEHKPLMEAHLESQSSVQDRMLEMRLHLNAVEKDSAKKHHLIDAIKNYLLSLNSHFKIHDQPIFSYLDTHLSSEEKNNLMSLSAEADQNEFSKANQTSSQIINNFLSSKTLPTV